MTEGVRENFDCRCAGAPPEPVVSTAAAPESVVGNRTPVLAALLDTRVSLSSPTPTTCDKIHGAAYGVPRALPDKPALPLTGYAVPEFGRLNG